MIKIVFATFMVIAALKMHSQDLTLTFNGLGAANSVDNITALNQSTGISVTFTGNIVYMQSIVNSSEKIIKEQNLKVWPNPCVGDAYFEIPVVSSCNARFEVMNSLGQNILTSTYPIEAGYNLFSFTPASKGIYYILVYAKGSSHQFTVISNTTKTGKCKIECMNTGNGKKITDEKSLKNGQSNVIYYTLGDRILFRANSGNYITLITDIPDKNKVYDVQFANCLDGDNNQYPIVQIGSQLWMAENLKTTRYNDNSPIPLVTDGETWYSKTTPAFCYYNNDPFTYKNKCGALYNWYTVDSASNSNKNVCPVGWHIPSDEEWAIMENYLIANGYNYDGSFDNDGDRNTTNKIAKSLGAITTWPNIYNITGTIGKSDFPEKRNSSGFTALPGGSRIGRNFYSIDDAGFWWTKTGYDVNKAIFRYIESGSISIYKHNDKSRSTGFSVRCVKD